MQSISICYRCQVPADEAVDGCCEGSKVKFCGKNCKEYGFCKHKSRCFDCKKKKAKSCSHHRIVSYP